MSRRFGRNQKRALRREIARWQEAHGMAEDLLRHTAKARDRLHAELEFCKQALGPDFIGFELRDAINCIYLQHNDTFQMLSAGGDGSITVHALRMQSKDDSKDPRNQFHFRVRLGGSEVAYAVSEPAMYRTPAPVLAARIANEMATYLIDHIRQFRSPHHG